VATELTRYEFEDRVVAAVKKRGGAVTVGDVSADTGLPLEETELALRHMLSVYKSHLDVDDDGNLRYRFDQPMIRRGEDPGRLWADIKKWSWNAFVFLFKIWIMVTLVGYTALFILILIALAVASIALATQTDSDADELIGLPFYLLARALEFFFWISIFDDGRSSRRRSRRFKRKKPKVDKPFYQKIFDYVFGPERKSDPLAAQQAFADFVRARNGRVTAAEWASRTGQTLEQAENALTASLVRFRGDVDVSDEGVLVYRFDDLRVSAREGRTGGDLPPIWTKRAQAPPLTGNPSGTNTWITVFNLFNLVMSSFFAFTLMGQPNVDPAIAFGLGWVPFVFSLVFFAIPIVRSMFNTAKKKKAVHENDRREELRKIWQASVVDHLEPVVLQPKLADEMVKGYDGDVQVLDDGRMVYLFDTIARERRAGEQARQAARDQVVFGQTVFSSDDEEVSLEQAELDDFDRRLAKELEGSHLDFEVSAPAVEYAN
jgi:hypothetical protein